MPDIKQIIFVIKKLPFLIISKSGTYGKFYSETGGHWEIVWQIWCHFLMQFRHGELPTLQNQISY